MVKDSLCHIWDNHEDSGHISLWSWSRCNWTQQKTQVETISLINFTTTLFIIYSTLHYNLIRVIDLVKKNRSPRDLRASSRLLARGLL